MLKNYYIFTFEKFDSDGNPQAEFHYDSEGLIGPVFTYNPLADRMILADAEAIQDTKLYKDAEAEIYHIVRSPDFLSSVRYGT